MPKYHVVLSDGTERDVVADRYDVEGLALVFRNGDDGIDPDADARRVTYAPGTWRLVEPEARDDRG